MAHRIFTLAFLLVLGCSRNNDTTSSDIDRYAAAYADLLTLHESYKISDSTFTHTEYMARVNATLQHHGVNANDLKQTLTALTKSPDNLTQFYQKVTERLEEMRSRRSP
ncbi:MAG TPA: hypothetical protein VNN76_06090 [Bacteroidota bacterium]|nr:hypothetical protein [Bacteroidota bacterium]